jgi:hypothetical protein
VAKDLGLKASAGTAEIAKAFSDGYRGTFRQAAFEGCLAGL